MTQLAIKGHATRGKEVIELLEMLGGGNPYACKAIRRECFYFIVEGEIDYDEERYITDEYTIFTLEEFLEKYPYKVGDKVSSKYLKNYKIEKMEWEDTNHRVIYKLQGMGWYSADDLQPYKEESMEERKYSELRMPLDDDDKLATEVTIDGNKILPPNGYLIGKITQLDNGMFVEYVKKQSQYPKTYEECCMILQNACMTHKGGYKGDLIQLIQKLIICRDAYWKITGEQMGLGKPWEPDWLNTEQDKFVLYTHNNVVCLNRFVLGHNVLAFPTAEMRDAFLENFKDLIERCKEFL